MAFSSTVKQLRHQAARQARDLWTGVLSDAAAEGDLTLRALTRVELDGFFANSYIQLGADAQAEEHRLINNGPQSLVLANDGGVVTPREVGEVYEIHQLWATSDYNAFIYDAIRSIASEAVLASLDDQTIVLTANTANPNNMEDEYEIPEGFRYISEVWIADTLGHFSTRVPKDEMSIVPGSTKKLKFSRWASYSLLEVGRTVRLLGQGFPPIPTLGDSDVVTVDPDFITNYVVVRVLEPLIGGTNARAVAAGRQVQALIPALELKRITAAGEHRVIAGSMTMPS